MELTTKLFNGIYGIILYKIPNSQPEETSIVSNVKYTQNIIWNNHIDMIKILPTYESTLL